MNWFGRIFSRLTGTGAQPASRRVPSTGRTDAGIYVDADTALRNATVWACVQYLTRAVGQLPWNVMTTVDGRSAVAATHPAHYLLSKRPCSEYGPFSWRQTMLGNALLRGNAYAEIERDNRGAPYALWPIHPERVCPRRNASGVMEYEVWNTGANVVLPARDMFHVRGFGDGPVGYGVVEYAAQSIGWAQATELFGATYFGEGLNPKVIIKMPQDVALSPEAKDQLLKDLDQLYRGPRGRRAFVADAGMDVEKLGAAPDESQFIETRQHQVEEICRWFGVPPHKVMHLLRATFSNIEHQAIEVVVDCVTPWVRLFEEEADYKLFGGRAQGSYYTKMKLQALMRGDNASRLSFYKGLVEIGVPINRILELEDMNGIGLDGEVSLVSQNLQTLRHAIEGDAAGAPPHTSDTPNLQAPMARGGING